MKSRICLMVSAAMALTSAPAFAQAAAPAAAAAKPAAGATVYDQAGAVVGTIESVSGDLAVLATQKSKVSVPLASFGTGEKGPVIALTRDQIDQQAGAAAAQSAQAQEEKKKAQLTAGATVKDPQGGTVGTIKSVDGQFALVDTTTAQVRLPLTAFAAGDTGPVIGLTKAELDAQAAAAAGGAAAGKDGSGGAR